MEFIYIILFLTIIILPLIFLWWGYRRYLRWRARRTEAVQSHEDVNEPVAGGYSFPLGIPLIIYPLLYLGTYYGRRVWWGKVCLAVFILLIVMFTYSGFQYR